MISLRLLLPLSLPLCSPSSPSLLSILFLLPSLFSLSLSSLPFSSPLSFPSSSSLPLFYLPLSSPSLLSILFLSLFLLSPSPLPPQTYIGSVLVSINPYQALGIYTSEFVSEYRSRNIFEMPPHMYVICSGNDTVMSGWVWSMGHVIYICVLL